MSWINQNYEKAALGGAAVVALGLALWGWSKVGGVEEDFTADLRGSGNTDSSVATADAVEQAQASLGLKRIWEQEILENKRTVDLFAGIPLFVGRDDPQRAIDPWEGEPIHPPIPNIWWIDNRLDPGFADSPARDPDGDGYSNLEEFTAKTDPNDSKSHPALVAKLKYVKDESLKWVLSPRFDIDGAFPMRYFDDLKRTNNAGAGAPVAVGELFFANEPMKNRFKLLGSEVREELNPSINREVEVTLVRIEDQRPNKKGTIYEIPASLPDGRFEEFAQFDRTAVLSLEALGLEGQEFKIEENTRFSLPHKQGGADYLLKTVTPNSITVEWVDDQNETRTIEIPKGGLPQ